MDEQAAGNTTRPTEASPTGNSLRSERSGVAAQTGTAGVSDTRRAELERLEADAGAAHDAADRSVPEQPATGRPASDASDLARTNPETRKR